MSLVQHWMKILSNTRFLGLIVSTSFCRRFVGVRWNIFQALYLMKVDASFCFLISSLHALHVLFSSSLIAHLLLTNTSFPIVLKCEYHHAKRANVFDHDVDTPMFLVQHWMKFFQLLDFLVGTASHCCSLSADVLSTLVWDFIRALY